MNRFTPGRIEAEASRLLHEADGDAQAALLMVARLLDLHLHLQHQGEDTGWVRARAIRIQERQQGIEDNDGTHVR